MSRVCPKCHSIAHYNSYFGAYICEECDWFYDVQRPQQCNVISNVEIQQLRKERDDARAQVQELQAEYTKLKETIELLEVEFQSM